MGFEMDREVKSLGDCCIYSSVKELKLDQRNRIGGDCYMRRTLGRPRQNLVVSREVLTKRRYVLETS